jgi:AcrR family transcriptional regulator
VSECGLTRIRVKMYDVSSSTRTYAGLAAGERRDRRRAQLLTAALDEVLAVGAASVTAEGVCARAGLTKRYFYESFGDREELLATAAQELFDAIWAAVLRAVDSHPDNTPAQTRAAVEALADALVADPRGARLYVECPALPALSRRREEAIARFAALAADRLLPFSADFPDGQRLLVARFVVAGATDVMTAWLAGELGADRDDVVAAILRAALTGCSG